MKNKKKPAIALSYLNLFAGMVVNVFLTPMLITNLGDLDYSLYKVMQSFAGPLSMFHLGVATVVTRSIVKCTNDKDYTELDKKNTMALAMIASVFMAIIIVIVGACMYISIPTLFGETYSSTSLKTGQHIFAMFVLASVLHMLTDVFSGCILGHERYTISSLIPLLKTLFKCILLITLLKCKLGVQYVVAVDLVLAIGVFAVSAIYAVAVLHEIPKLTNFDIQQLMEIFSFGLAILLQAFVNQVNNNLDTMILGKFVAEKAVITMYSSALTVYSIYNSMVSVLSHYYLPNAAKLVTQKASGRELTDFIIKNGRFQAVIALACVFGFVLFGQNFITIWIGSRYQDAYAIVLILMIPVTIPLIQNAVISILDAAMKRIIRSLVLVLMAVLNLIISVILVQHWNFWGAAIGTAFSLILGHGILMNIYYAKAFRIEISRMFREILRGILPAGLFSLVISIPLSLCLPDTVVCFILKCVCFMAIYSICLYLFGFNQDEKGQLWSIVKNLNKHR